MLIRTISLYHYLPHTTLTFTPQIIVFLLHKETISDLDSQFFRVARQELVAASVASITVVQVVLDLRKTSKHAATHVTTAATAHQAIVVRGAVFVDTVVDTVVVYKRLIAVAV